MVWMGAAQAVRVANASSAINQYFSFTRAIRWSFAAVLTAGLALGGCVVAPVGPPRYYAGATIGFAPPAPRVEVVGVAPAPGYIQGAAATSSSTVPSGASSMML
jgi:hypothetical protein